MWPALTTVLTKTGTIQLAHNFVDAARPKTRVACAELTLQGLYGFATTIDALHSDVIKTVTAMQKSRRCHIGQRSRGG
jgi:hypothetical protein